MYEVGTRIVYGSSGVCEVSAVCETEFSKNGQVYYTLTPVGTTSCVYVPVDSEPLTARMRPLYTPDALREALSSAGGERLEWIDNAHLRGKYFQEVLLSCDPAQMFRLVQTLYHRAQMLAERGKKNLMADEAILKKAERILFGEISEVLGIGREELPAFLEELSCLR